MRKRVWAASVCVGVALVISACQSNQTPATPDSTAGQSNPTAGTNTEPEGEVTTGTPHSVTMTVEYPWTKLVNSSVDPQPQDLNADADTTCSMAQPVETCDSPGPFKGDKVTIICLAEGGIAGVVIPEKLLVRPDQVRFRSKEGNLPVGFLSFQAVGGWDYMPFKGLADDLGVTVEDGLECEKHTVRLW